MSVNSLLAGTVASFPVSLIVATSLLKITFMEITGAPKSISTFVKTLAPRNKAVQIMLTNVGAGTMLLAVGITPVSILTPILISLGYSIFVAIALPAIGFDALCTFAILGAPLVVYSDMTGASLVHSARVFAKFLPVILTRIGFGMLWIVGRWELVRNGLIPCIIAGFTNGGVAVAVSYITFLGGGVVLTGVIAGFCTIVVMLFYLKLTGSQIIDKSVLTAKDLTGNKMPLLIAISPWILLIVAAFIINFYPSCFDFLFKQLNMIVSFIPGQSIKTRAFWNACTLVPISTVVAALFIRPNGAQIKETMRKWLMRAPRPTYSATIFFAIVFVMNNLGMQNLGSIWKVVEPSFNMIWVLSEVSATTIGSLYPFISGFLGLFGGCLTDSEASTIAMFTKYHLITLKLLNVDPLIAAAATAIGGGPASVISPAKLQMQQRLLMLSE